MTCHLSPSLPPSHTHAYTQPSLPILQSFVDSCSKEKAYSRLATVVRRAKDCGLHLEKTFYQRALVLLRPWGQDQVAISIIYKSLRTIDTETAPIPLTTVSIHLHVYTYTSPMAVVCSFQNSTVFGSVSHVSAMPPLLREAHCDSGRSTPGSQVSRTSSSRPCSSKSHKSRRSLEGIFEKSNELPSIKPGIIALLEVYTCAYVSIVYTMYTYRYIQCRSIGKYLLNVLAM